MVARALNTPSILTPAFSNVLDVPDLEARLDRMNRLYWARLLLSGEAQRLWPALYDKPEGDTSNV